MFEKITTFLSEALPYVDARIATDINAGGCGVFAEMLYLRLHQIGIESDIIVMTWDSEDFDNVVDKPDALAEGGVTHVVVRINGDYYDSNGLRYDHESLRGSRVEVQVTPDELHELIEMNIWNSDFDRSYIPEMNRLMDYVFSKYPNYAEGEFRAESDSEPYPYQMALSIFRLIGQ
jgi:hypothetical protein